MSKDYILLKHEAQFVEVLTAIELTEIRTEQRMRLPKKGIPKLLLRLRKIDRHIRIGK